MLPIEKFFRGPKVALLFLVPSATFIFKHKYMYTCIYSITHFCYSKSAFFMVLITSLLAAIPTAGYEYLRVGKEMIFNVLKMLISDLLFKS